MGVWRQKQPGFGRPVNCADAERYSPIAGFNNDLGFQQRLKLFSFQAFITKFVMEIFDEAVFPRLVGRNKNRKIGYKNDTTNNRSFFGTWNSWFYFFR